jgi:2-O-methyltransferase
MKINSKQIRSLLGKGKIVFLELGSHNGEDTMTFLKEFCNIKLYCFEPDPRCISIFKRRIKDKRCRLIEAAVSDQDGRCLLNMSSGIPPFSFSQVKNKKIILDFYKLLNLLKRFTRIGYEWDQSSSIAKPLSECRAYPWLEFNKSVDVETIKLDTFTCREKLDIIDFMWVDIQGAEARMIKGAPNTLRNTRYIYIEYGEKACYTEALSRKETLKIMKDKDFTMLEHYSDNAETGNMLFVNNKLQ